MKLKFINYNVQHKYNKKITTILINSHRNSKIALNFLLDSMKKYSEFKTYNIIICIGGFYENSNYIINKEDNITYILCNHNSIDFTGLITVLDLFPNEENTYLYLHDTSSIGPNFFNIISNIKINGDTASLVPQTSMNMGIYTSYIIKQYSLFLDSCRNTDETKVQYFKTQAVYNEDKIFKSNKNHTLLENYGRYTDNILTDVYNTGTMRITEYYKCLDLFKYKANWGLKNIYELNN